MIETKVAHEIIEKAIEIVGRVPNISHLDLYRGYKSDDEHSMYYYNRVTKRYNSQHTAISSLKEEDIDELIELLEEYNNTLRDTVNTLLEGEYSWVDVDTFRYCYRAGVDYGYCHITKLK